MRPKQCVTIQNIPANNIINHLKKFHHLCQGKSLALWAKVWANSSIPLLEVTIIGVISTRGAHKSPFSRVAHVIWMGYSDHGMRAFTVNECARGRSLHTPSEGWVLIVCLCVFIVFTALRSHQETALPPLHHLKQRWKWNLPPGFPHWFTIWTKCQRYRARGRMRKNSLISISAARRKTLG